jgi:hypothetical protein
LASAAPRSPYRHLELCGIALRIKCQFSTEKFWNPLALMLHEGRIRKASLKNKNANRK